MQIEGSSRPTFSMTFGMAAELSALCPELWPAEAEIENGRTPPQVVVAKFWKPFFHIFGTNSATKWRLYRQRGAFLYERR